MSECCRKCLKVFLFGFNLIFFLIGGAAVGLAAWILLKSDDVLKLIDFNTDTIDIPALLEHGAYSLIAAGCLVMFVSALGAIGACKQSRVLLIAYAIIVILLLILQLAAIILAVMFKDKIEEKLSGFLNDTLVNHYEGNLDSKEPFSVLWDSYQISRQCCGIRSQDDYLYTAKWNRSLPVAGSVVPWSCCVFTDSSQYLDNPDSLQPVDYNCTVTPTNQTVWLDKGCFGELKNDLHEAAVIVIISGAVVLLIEILGVVLAFCLCRLSPKKGQKVV